MWERPNGLPQSILGSESNSLFLDRTVPASQRGGIWNHENSFHQTHSEIFYPCNPALCTSIKQRLTTTIYHSFRYRRWSHTFWPSVGQPFSKQLHTGDSGVEAKPYNNMTNVPHTARINLANTNRGTNPGSVRDNLVSRALSDKMWEKRRAKESRAESYLRRGSWPSRYSSSYHLSIRFHCGSS